MKIATVFQYLFLALLVSRQSFAAKQDVEARLYSQALYASETSKRPDGALIRKMDTYLVSSYVTQLQTLATKENVSFEVVSLDKKYLGARTRAALTASENSAKIYAQLRTRSECIYDKTKCPSLSDEFEQVDRQMNVVLQSMAKTLLSSKSSKTSLDLGILEPIWEMAGLSKDGAKIRGDFRSVINDGMENLTNSPEAAAKLVVGVAERDPAFREVYNALRADTGIVLGKNKDFYLEHPEIRQQETLKALVSQLAEVSEELKSQNAGKEASNKIPTQALMANVAKLQSMMSTLLVKQGDEKEALKTLKEGIAGIQAGNKQQLDSSQNLSEMIVALRAEILKDSPRAAMAELARRQKNIQQAQNLLLLDLMERKKNQQLEAVIRRKQMSDQEVLVSMQKQLRTTAIASSITIQTIGIFDPELAGKLKQVNDICLTLNDSIVKAYVPGKGFDSLSLTSGYIGAAMALYGLLKSWGGSPADSFETVLFRQLRQLSTQIESLREEMNANFANIERILAKNQFEVLNAISDLNRAIVATNSTAQFQALLTSANFVAIEKNLNQIQELLVAQATQSADRCFAKYVKQQEISVANCIDEHVQLLNFTLAKYPTLPSLGSFEARLNWILLSSDTFPLEGLAAKNSNGQGFDLPSWHKFEKYFLQLKQLLYQNSAQLNASDLTELRQSAEQLSELYVKTEKGRISEIYKSMNAKTVSAQNLSLDWQRSVIRSQFGDRLIGGSLFSSPLALVQQFDESDVELNEIPACDASSVLPHNIRALPREILNEIPSRFKLASLLKLGKVQLCVRIAGKYIAIQKYEPNSKSDAVDIFGDGKSEADLQFKDGAIVLEIEGRFVPSAAYAGVLRDVARGSSAESSVIRSLIQNNGFVSESRRVLTAFRRTFVGPLVDNLELDGIKTAVEQTKFLDQLQGKPVIIRKNMNYVSVNESVSISPAVISLDFVNETRWAKAAGDFSTKLSGLSQSCKSPTMIGSAEESNLQIQICSYLKELRILKALVLVLSRFRDQDLAMHYPVAFASIAGQNSLIPDSDSANALVEFMRARSEHSTLFDELWKRLSDSFEKLEATELNRSRYLGVLSTLKELESAR